MASSDQIRGGLLQHAFGHWQRWHMYKSPITIKNEQSVVDVSLRIGLRPFPRLCWAWRRSSFSVRRRLPAQRGHVDIGPYTRQHVFAGR